MQQSQALTEALRSLLEWKFTPGELRNVQKQFENLRIDIEGRDKTREILEELP